MYCFLAILMAYDYWSTRRVNQGDAMGQRVPDRGGRDADAAGDDSSVARLCSVGRALVGVEPAYELSSVESEAMSLSASCIEPSIDCTRSVTSFPIETDVPLSDPIARAFRLCFRNST